ncbi:HlyD family type I secretion periplasmic adaptor subunit [Achromobacter xylosoxidans]
MGAFKELLAKYRDAWRTAWATRSETDPRRYRDEEAEFLPAALELQLRAASPLPRVLLWSLLGIAVATLLWATLGKVDIVAVAQGKIIPSDRTKVIQPVGTATIKAIFVQEGDTVAAGDILVELDDVAAKADIARISNEIAALSIEANRAQAMLDAIQTNTAPTVARPDDAPLTAWQDAQNLTRGEFATHAAKLRAIDAEILQRKAEWTSVQAQVKKLEATRPIARQRAASLRELAQEQYVPRSAYLEREQLRLELEGDLASQTSRLQELQAQIASAEEQKSSLIAESIQVNLERIRESRQKIESLRQEQIKAGQVLLYTRLTAPVSGTVQQLAVHTVGGVVMAAEKLMLVVPHEENVLVEAFLPNKDVGFVKKGQTAEIKVETFPYTRYGTLPALIESVSEDAIEDKELGLIYALRASIPKRTIRTENREARLMPGMQVTVEVKTGKRRIIQYFLDPLTQYAQESIRER